MIRPRILVLASLLAIGLLSPAQGAITFHTNQAVWQAAAGPLSFTENFSGFAVDTQFRTAPLAIGGGTIVQEGADQGFRNIIDVVPLDFPLISSGTNSGSLFTDIDTTFARITFSTLNSAFGFQAWDAASGEIAVLEVYDGATLIGGQTLTGASGEFLGYVTTGGTTATSVRFRSLNSLDGGEGFYIDNLAGVNASAAAVPEPTTFAMFGIVALGFAGAGWRRRKKPA